MKQPVIDIGSNSIRLTLYAIEDRQNFKILFREKIMAGLAGYVKDGALSAEGIACACDALLKFRRILEFLNMHEAAVFATASLRNVVNTKEALTQLEAETGFDIELLSGEEEALLGYMGAMRDLDVSGGVFTDIGGASTEIVIFDKGIAQNVASFSLGALSLYRSCVKRILPNSDSRERIEAMLEEEFDGKANFPRGKQSPMIAVGGTSRAVRKLAKRYFGFPEEHYYITEQQLDLLFNILCLGDRKAIDLILWAGAERIHTLVPGIMILRHIMKYFESDELIVSEYGVREGYLCQRLIKNNTSILKTES